MTTTSPKSGRQYITSFTTTTTVRPDLSRGVQIIRSLVEQARVTPPVPTGSVQSLTTLKTMAASKEMTNQHKDLMRTSTARPTTARTTTVRATTARTTTVRTTTSTRPTTTSNIPTNHRMMPISSTTRRMPTNHQSHDELIKSFTERPTTTARTRQKSRNTADAPIDINDIQDLLSKVPPTTTKAPSWPVRTVNTNETFNEHRFQCFLTVFFCCCRNQLRK